MNVDILNEAQELLITIERLKNEIGYLEKMKGKPMWLTIQVEGERAQANEYVELVGANVILDATIELKKQKKEQAEQRFKDL